MMSSRSGSSQRLRQALDASTAEPPPVRRGRVALEDEGGPVLVAAALDGAPELSGAVLLAGAAPAVFGRGAGDGSEERAVLVRQEPGVNVALGPLAATWLSRRQLRLQALDGDRLLIENLGRRQLRIRGVPCAQGVVGPGELVALEDVALFVVARRPQTLPPAESWTLPLHELGAPDAAGLVGEAAAMWRLRERIAFVARQRGHVLVQGPSGAGKERVAQAIHALSARAGRSIVARSAATIPHTLMDVELFGHVANYPNPGMRERAGIVGEAQGGTLFLDEIGELSDDLQAHLLRLMDAGEYQRLGDPRPRVADIRVVAATHRGAEGLKPDLRARFRHVITVPPLAERRDDIPLLTRHILRGALREDPGLGVRLFDAGEPRLDLGLVAALLVHPLPLQVRELEMLLWDAIASSPGRRIVAGPALAAAGAEAAAPQATPEELTPDAIQAAIDRHDGVLERVWRDLGLKNRYVLRRLIRKYGLEAKPADADEGD